jgi:hypothetical protein
MFQAWVRTRWSLFESVENQHLVVLDQDLKQLTAFYKPPNSQSQAVIDSGKLQLSDKLLDISRSEQQFILKISKALDLDQVQCFQLLRSFIRSEIILNDDFVTSGSLVLPFNPALR